MFGSPMVILLEEHVADGYNHFVEAFLKAQTDYKEKHGTEWDPSTSILIDVSEQDQRHYNEVAGLMNMLIDINQGALNITEEDIKSDFLIRQ